MFDNWEHFCECSRSIARVIKPGEHTKCSYPTDLPPWYTESDEMVGEIFPETLFFNPYISVQEEEFWLEQYEGDLECISDDEEEEVSDYEWDAIKDKFQY